MSQTALLQLSPGTIITVQDTYFSSWFTRFIIIYEIQVSAVTSNACKYLFLCNLFVKPEELNAHINLSKPQYDILMKQDGCHKNCPINKLPVSFYNFIFTHLCLEYVSVIKATMHNFLPWSKPMVWTF